MTTMLAIGSAPVVGGDGAALDGVAERDELVVVRRRALDLDGLRTGRRLDDELGPVLRRDRVGHEHPPVAPEHVETQDLGRARWVRSSSTRSGR